MLHADKMNNFNLLSFLTGSAFGKVGALLTELSFIADGFLKIEDIREWYSVTSFIHTRQCVSSAENFFGRI